MKKNMLVAAAMLGQMMTTSHATGFFHQPRDLWEKGEVDGDTIMKELKHIEERLGGKIQKQVDELKEKGASSEKLGQEIKDLGRQFLEIQKEVSEVKAAAGRLDQGGGHKVDIKTPGQLMVESKEFTERGKRFSAGIQVKALTTASGSAGVWAQPQRLPFFEAPREPHIRDLLSQGTTGANSLKFPVVNVRTNNAAVVAETAAKPESAITFVDKTFEVTKIATYVKLSTELLSDAPALQSYIDTQLIEMLKDVEDAEILKGDGTGDHLLGLYTQAVEYNRAVVGDTLVDTFRRAMTQLRLARYTPTGLVLNPEDWEAVQLLKASDDRYIFSYAPDSTGQMRVWAIPVRDTTALDEGEWLMGNFQRGAQIFDREEAGISMSNSDQDDFIKNKVTVLAEERLALVTYDINAFVKNAEA